LSDFKNSLKSLTSAGIAIEGPSQEFERPQTLLDQARDLEMRAVEPELVDLLASRFHNAGLALG